MVGCSWTPRNAKQGEGAGASTGSAAEQSPTATQGDSSAPAAVHDDFVLVNGGTFTMGSPADEPWRGDDESAHEVTVGDFYLAPMEVSRQEYSETMGVGDTGNVPVTGVTWYDAVAYCNALSDMAGLTPAHAIDGENVTWDRAANGYRLPTEAEWEYACRAGTTGPFNLGHSPQRR